MVQERCWASLVPLRVPPPLKPPTHVTSFCHTSHVTTLPTPPYVPRSFHTSHAPPSPLSRRGTLLRDGRRSASCRRSYSGPAGHIGGRNRAALHPSAHTAPRRPSSPAEDPSQDVMGRFDAPILPNPSPSPTKAPLQGRKPVSRQVGGNDNSEHMQRINWLADRVTGRKAITSMTY